MRLIAFLMMTLATPALAGSIQGEIKLHVTLSPAGSFVAQSSQLLYSGAIKRGPAASRFRSASWKVSSKLPVGPVGTSSAAPAEPPAAAPPSG